MQHAIVVSDTSCLILLTNIGALHLLQGLYKKVLITSIIAAEFGYPPPDWITVYDPKDNDKVQRLSENLDEGEASAIALALEEDCLLIIDESIGRKIAGNLGISVIGTLGLLVEAKRAGLVPEIKSLIEKVQATNFRVNDAVLKNILQKAGE